MKYILILFLLMACNPAEKQEEFAEETYCEPYNDDKAKEIADELSGLLGSKVRVKGKGLQVDDMFFPANECEIVTWKKGELEIKWITGVDEIMVWNVKTPDRDRVLVLICEFIALCNGRINLTVTNEL